MPVLPARKAAGQRKAAPASARGGNLPILNASEITLPDGTKVRDPDNTRSAEASQVYSLQNTGWLHPLRSQSRSLQECPRRRQRHSWPIFRLIRRRPRRCMPRYILRLMYSAIHESRLSFMIGRRIAIITLCIGMEVPEVVCFHASVEPSV
jgi:hypothetical protein